MTEKQEIQSFVFRCISIPLTFVWSIETGHVVWNIAYGGLYSSGCVLLCVLN